MLNQEILKSGCQTIPAKNSTSIKIFKLLKYIIKMQGPSNYSLLKIYLTNKDAWKLKVKGWKILFQRNGKEQQAGIAILVSDNIALKRTKREKEEHHIVIERSIQAKCQSI